MNDAPSLPVVFTMNEVAARLRISRRALQELVKKHPFYANNGRKKLFAEADIVALWEAMRSPETKRAEQRGGRSLSEEQASARAWKLLGEAKNGRLRK